MTIRTEPSPPTRPRGHRLRWITAIGAVVLVVAGILVATLWRSGGPRDASPGVPPPNPSSASSGPASSAPAPAEFPYQPLWPFSDANEAAAWQRSFREGGHQPWHLDAAQTASSFTQGYLGYAGVNLTTSNRTTGNQAWIGVGYVLPNGRTATAAVVHLAKLGSGTDAPWEVVGTEDSTLTLTQPAYGSAADSPVTVGGRITGVDENLHVRIFELRHRQVGEAGGIPAGGQNTPWSARVPFSAPAGSVLTIAVSTGGHVTDVERFAITGVRAGRSGASADGDVDGDGRADTITFPAPGRLYIAYATGKTETVGFDVADGYTDVALLGAVDADQDGHAEIFVRTGSGASTQFATVFRYFSGHLAVVTLDGKQSGLAYGGTVTHQDSWACRPPAEPVLTWSGTSTDGQTFTGTARSYRFDGFVLARIAERPLTVTPANPAPTGCGSLNPG
jgi:hypothetical protein